MTRLLMTSCQDTIVAPATATGGALALIRMSGPETFRIMDEVFRPARGRTLSSRPGFSIAYGDMVDIGGNVVDDVLVSVFRSPNSYTGEDMAEISCHGSSYIVRRIMELLMSRGARTADAGEFTSRAFLAGKMDLSQAEAVADMIASRDRATHAMAVAQMRGGYSGELGLLRSELLKLASLLELELDFSEEDVEFADRSELSALTDRLTARLSSLSGSFLSGNAIKEGIGVAIVGSPNVGKSTLLNTLLRDDRAMVSDIAGTTRDVIEERMTLDGVEYRFIDTAGIRESGDTLERMGIERTFRALEKASVLLYLFDINSGIDAEGIRGAVTSLPLRDGQKVCVVLNKCDASHCGGVASLTDGVSIPDDAPVAGKVRELESVLGFPVVAVSAKYGNNISALTDFLSSLVDREAVFRGDTVVSNARHYEALAKADEALRTVRSGIATGLSGDLLAQDIRQALYWLGTITGEITTDEILGEIFSKFCIGK